MRNKIKIKQISSSLLLLNFILFIFPTYFCKCCKDPRPKFYWGLVLHNLSSFLVLSCICSTVISGIFASKRMDGKTSRWSLDRNDEAGHRIALSMLATISWSCYWNRDVIWSSACVLGQSVWAFCRSCC